MRNGCTKQIACRVILAAILLAAAGQFVRGHDEEHSVYEPEVQTKTVLQASENSLGQPIIYPKTDHAEVTGIEVVIPPGAQTGWHTHSAPGFAYIISGELTIEIEGRAPLVLRAGEACAEVVGALHDGRNLGTEPVKLVAFFLGEKGEEFTKRRSEGE